MQVIAASSLLLYVATGVRRQREPAFQLIVLAPWRVTAFRLSRDAEDAIFSCCSTAAFSSLLRSATMGKANKQKAKKLAKKRAKTLLKSRDDDAMVIDEETPSAPLTGRQKHAQKVAAKRALRAAKQDIQQQRWAIPKRSVDRKAERKQLVEQAKALRREGTADATDAPAPPDDAPMAEKPTFAYAVDAKKARKAAKRRAKERAREARYDGDVQKTP